MGLLTTQPGMKYRKIPLISLVILLFWFTLACLTGDPLCPGKVLGRVSDKLAPCCHSHAECLMLFGLLRTLMLLSLPLALIPASSNVTLNSFEFISLFTLFPGISRFSETSAKIPCHSLFFLRISMEQQQKDYLGCHRIRLQSGWKVAHCHKIISYSG